MRRLARASALPLSAGAVAMLVATPLSVGWGAMARDLFALPADYGLADPAFLLAATAGVSSMVALAFVLTARYAREHMALGLVAAGLLLAITLAAWLVGPLLAYPDVAAGPIVGVVTHLLAGGVSAGVVLFALAERRREDAS